MTMQTCLVTGGAGFIGSAASRDLCDAFDDVVVVDVLHPQVHPQRLRPQALDPRARLIVGDICDPAVWAQVLDGFAPDLVVHLAAETGTGQSLTEATRHAHVNVTGTAVMLDALAKLDRKPRKLLLTSSRAVYGEGPWEAEDGAVVYPGQRSVAQLTRHQWDFPCARPLRASAGSSQPAPVSVYGATKLAQENMLAAWCRAMDVDHTVLRLQNVYGVGQSLSNPYTGIISLFCRLARQGESLPLYEDGAMLRDFIYIDDVVAMLMRAIATRTTGPVDVGTGHSVSIEQAARIIAAHYGAPAPHVCARYRFGDVRHAICDVSRTTSEFGWEAKVDVAEGVARLAGWIDREFLAASPATGSTT